MEKYIRRQGFTERSNLLVREFQEAVEIFMGKMGFLIYLEIK